jgi:hypothetical protein
VVKSTVAPLTAAVPPFSYSSEYVIFVPAFAAATDVAATKAPGTLEPMPSTYTCP